MHLSRVEELIYQGQRGESLRRAMEILVALGDIFDAERLKLLLIQMHSYDDTVRLAMSIAYETAHIIHETAAKKKQKKVP